MPETSAAERTTVIATYSSRRDAEIAQDRLEDERIESFVAADDAGGMHPQLQQTQGVDLVVLGDERQQATEVLEKAALLSDERSGPAEATGNAEQTGDGLFSSKRLRFFAATVLLMLVFLLVLLSGWG